MTKQRFESLYHSFLFSRDYITRDRVMQATDSSHNSRHPTGQTVRFGPSCDETKAKPKVMGGRGRGLARGTAAAAAGNSNTHRVIRRRSRAASQLCRAAPTTFPRVGHHVQERWTRAEADDGQCHAPRLCQPSSGHGGPPVEQLSADERRAKVRRGCGVDGEPFRGKGEGGGPGAGGEWRALCTEAAVGCGRVFKGGDGLFAVCQVLH
jgi:hypothetical protein